MTDERTDYLAAYRRSAATPPGVREDNLAAIYERAAAIDEEEAAPRTRWAASALVLKISTAALLTTGVGVAVAMSQREPTPEPVASAAAPSPSAPVATAVPRPPAAPKEVTAEPAQPEPVPLQAPAPTPRARKKPSAPQTSPDQLEQELTLIESAREHLEAGRRDDARRSLREHARRFPAGTLATEREAWAAIVQCGGESSQPRAAARSFVLTHEDTPLAAKVKRACKL
ncbi:MAG: hypothetical protein AAGA54_33075 [Myxococcota bacterium]